MSEQKYIVTPKDPTTPTAIACRHMGFREIESLMNEKCDNMYLYIHYDMTDESANQMAFQTTQETRGCLISGQETKNILERKIPQIDLVACAARAIEIPTTSRIKGHQIVGNVIFRDKITGKFHALNNWINLAFEPVSCVKPSYTAAMNRMFSQLRRTAKVKSDNKLMQTVLLHKIYESLNKVRG